MVSKTTILLWATLALSSTAQGQSTLSFKCPTAVGKLDPFSVSGTALVTLKKTRSGQGSLCTLTLEQDDGTFVPVALSYDGNQWERAGGSFAAGMNNWVCNANACSARLPDGAKYVLQTRATAANLNFTAQVARFLEAASFGATPDGLNAWGNKTFAEYIKEQVEMKPTMHRELFRSYANPRWTFDHPEFAARLNPCAPDSTWRRQVLTVKDRSKALNVRRVADRWELSIDGYVRTMAKQIRFVNAFKNWNDTLSDGGSYLFCSLDEETHRGIYKVIVNNTCRPLVADDLMIDFPPGYKPAAVLNGTIPALGSITAWQKISDNMPEYMAKGSIGTILCNSLPASAFRGTPVFAKTADGLWMQFDPRIMIAENSLVAPLIDGGAGSWLANRTTYCSNVPRSFLNEETCVMSNTVACAPGAQDKSTAAAGVIVCGSPGEVGNDLGLGDGWLDVSSIPGPRGLVLGFQKDTTTFEAFAQQREFVWSEVVLKSDDQLRQRMAFALFYIFSLPKSAILGEQLSTEIFVQYYDIFVRNAFGNYRDILREVAYNPLMAESLTYVGSRSVAASLAKVKTVTFPDENFARELMQLFTIGLVELNMDGTPVLDAENNTIQTYDSDDIMSFARAWTGFDRNANRANVESPVAMNRIDPLTIEPAWRDRFPKADLAGGYIGDYFPLCVDLPEKAFLRIGAKYRLLGRSPLPELMKDDWASSPSAQRLILEQGSSGLYQRLCSPSATGSCTFPSVVVLDTNLACLSNATECNVDTVRVVQVNNLFYEYIRVPCVEQPFFDNAQKVAGLSKMRQPMCANPALTVASEACCEPNVTARNMFAQPDCMFAGERMTRDTAQGRCASIGKQLCDYVSFTPTAKCPGVGYRWTNQGCKIRVKVNADGQAAVVHDVSYAPVGVSTTTPSFFRVYWEGELYPSVENNCTCSAYCEQVDGACLCDFNVTDSAVFSSPPAGASDILAMLRVGHAGPDMYNENEYMSKNVSNYRYHSFNGSCCNQDTVFEVTDRNGETKFLRNVKSTVTVVGTDFKFLNPPQFNSLMVTEYSIADAQHETDAVLDHLFYHQNTPPFLALRFIQRFGISNPTPRYVLAVATAFQAGAYSMNGLSFGSSKYGDLEATLAAVLLDREARSLVLDNDPYHGSMREPILKVIAFMRATEFESAVPLVELDLMNQKIGQMAYEQASVFSFFRPDYSPSETTSPGLAAPEAEVMSSGKVVGLLNGLFSLVKQGLVQWNGGFGAYGADPSQNSSGVITYGPSNIANSTEVVRDLSNLLTGGRLGVNKQNTILGAISNEADPLKAVQLALQLIVTSPEFHSTNKVDPQASVPPQSTEQRSGAPQPGYKAVIHLALIGGCDSFNVLVPHKSCVPLYQEYRDMRGSIALTTAQVLLLAGNTSATQPCDSFTVHNGLPFVNKLYSDQDLLFMANVGVLTQPVDKTNYKLKTETELFAHNTMQEEIGSLDPKNTAVGTGALGRMADILYTKGFETGRTAVESSPDNLVGLSKSLPPIVTMDQEGVSLFNVDPSSPNMTEVIKQLNGDPGERSGVYGEVWSSLLTRSLNQTDELFGILESTPTKTVFAETDLGKRFKLIAQLIAAREARGIDRDFFFVPFDGFDTHSAVTATLNGNFLELNEALEEFVTELQLLGVWNDVVIVQTSDFGRTLTANTGGGTDHGWGGNYWMAGGSVMGKRIVGEYPSTLATDGNLSLDRGRFIPTTPWDSVFNAVADWVGVDTEQDLNSVLPNRGAFNNLFTAKDLFN